MSLFLCIRVFLFCFLILNLLLRDNLNCPHYLSFIAFSLFQYWVCCPQITSGRQRRGYLHSPLELHWFPVHYHHCGLHWGKCQSLNVRKIWILKNQYGTYTHRHQTECCGFILYLNYRIVRLIEVTTVHYSFMSLYVRENFVTLYLSCSTQDDLRESRPVRQYKNFQIEKSSNGFGLYGTDTVRPTLTELLEHLESQNLRTDNLHFQLLRCCPPQPRGELNSATDQQRKWYDDVFFLVICRKTEISILYFSEIKMEGRNLFFMELLLKLTGLSSKSTWDFSFMFIYVYMYLVTEVLNSLIALG